MTEAPSGSTAAAALLSELVGALHAESDALVAGDPERLTEVAARKNELLQQLAPAVRAAPAAHQQQHAKVLRAAQRLSERNARILALRLSIHRTRTEALLGAAGTSVYSATGTVAAPHATASRRHARTSA